MEMPIQVMIVLFVAIVVGTSILMFSQKSLLQTEERLNEIGELSEEDGLQVITLGDSATSEDILYLAEACADKNAGGLVTDECFVVRGEIPSVSSLDGEPVDTLTISVSASSGDSALFINFNPAGTIDITS